MFLFYFYFHIFFLLICMSGTLQSPSLSSNKFISSSTCLIMPVPLTPQSRILQSITNNFFYSGFISSSSFFLCVHFHVPPIFAHKVGGTVRFCAHSSHTAELFMPLISNADPRGLHPCLTHLPFPPLACPDCRQWSLIIIDASYFAVSTGIRN